MRGYRKWLWTAALLAVPGVVSAGDLFGRRTNRSASQNQQMANRIAQVLESQGRFDDCDIVVEYSGGNAVLRGTVNDPAQRQQAILLTQGVRGVSQVSDQLSFGGVALPVGGTASVGQPQLANRWYVQEGTPSPLPAESHMGDHQHSMPMAGGASGGHYDMPHFPPYAWPSYAAYPNYASVTYPQQYSASAWPYIGPFYPYPQVPLGWRKVELQWDDGWWFLDFDD